jgi:hypothetical protein
MASGLAGQLGQSELQWHRSSGYRVMSLAFFKGRPSISQRTVNETVQAAYLLNQNGYK